MAYEQKRVSGISRYILDLVIIFVSRNSVKIRAYAGPNYIFPSLYPSVTPITTQIWGCRGCKSSGVDLHPILLVTEPLLQSLKGSCTPNFCIWRSAIWDRFLKGTRYRGNNSNGKIKRTLVLGNLSL